MGGLLMLAMRLGGGIFLTGGPLWQRVLVLLAFILLGLVSYFALAHVSGAMTLGEFKRLIRR
jgi:hypothetical protein